MISAIFFVVAIVAVLAFIFWLDELGLELPWLIATGLLLGLLVGAISARL